MKTITVKTEVPIRINKYLSDQGIASRRGADDLIARSLVSVNGRYAKTGEKIKSGDIIQIASSDKKLQYVLYYKPRGEVTGPLRLFPLCHPVGRLDKESEGLLLYTNDHRVVDALLNPKYAAAANKLCVLSIASFIICFSI